MIITLLRQITFKFISDITIMKLFVKSGTPSFTSSKDYVNNTKPK